MTHEQETVLLIKGAMSDLTPEQRQEFDECYRQIRQIVTTYPMGCVALGLIGAELAAEE